MALVALIQNMHQSLNVLDPKDLSGMARQVYDRFFEILVAESGHALQTAHSLDDYLRQYQNQPDIIICAPFPPEGNLAPGFVRLRLIREKFPDTPVIVWSDRTEESVEKSVLQDYGAVHYYTGTLLEAADAFADLILQYT